MNSYYAAAERLRRPRAVRRRSRRRSTSPTAGFVGVGDDRRPGRDHRGAKTVVLAAGGFESNLEWLKEIWGDAADNFIIRGTPYNTGTVLKLMLDAGAQPVGDPTQCHAVAIDARAPKFDGGIVTRLDSRVARHRRQRARPNGSTTRARTSGRSATRSGDGSSRSSRDQIAYSIVDAKAIGAFHAVGVSADGGAVDSRAGARCSAWRRTRSSAPSTAFNRARAARHVRSRGAGRLPDRRADARTRPIGRRPLDTPPFWGYPLRPGITFTYLGLEGGRARARPDDRTESRRRTSSRPARSWPATFSARATSPASA